MIVNKSPAPKAVELGFKVVCSVMVFRHGDRAPAINFQEGSPKATAERARWGNVVADGQALGKLQKRFPVVRVASNAASDVEKALAGSSQGIELEAGNDQASSFKPIQVELGKEIQQSPFGRISKLGMEQLFQRGRQTRERYRDVLCNIDGAPPTVAFSTDFSRTQHSAQSFLDGLFPATCQVAGNVCIPIRVPPSSCDVANSWEAHEVLRTAVANASKQDPFFDRLEEQNAQARHDLIEKLPYYSCDAERFLWVYACDYFICNESHDFVVDPELRKHRASTLDITFARFLRWYSQPDICNLAAGDILRSIKGIMATKVKPPGGCVPAGPLEFVLYSGHDITVLPILCALRAFRHAVSDKVPDGFQTHFESNWPSYGSLLVFELLQSLESEHFYVRVLYNDQEIIPPCRFVTFWKNQVFFDIDNVMHASL